MKEDGSEKKLWFRCKAYGWGWEPATWEGWVTVLVYALVAAGVLIIPTLKTDTISIWQWIAFVAVHAYGISFIAQHGEKPRWQWGGKLMKKKEDSSKN